MKKFLHSPDGASKGAALIIVLAFVVLVTGLALAYFSRTTTDRQLAQSSYNDTSADLLARSALDITVSDLKQEILANDTYSDPHQYSAARVPAMIRSTIPNLIRDSSRRSCGRSSGFDCQFWTGASANWPFDQFGSLEQPLLNPSREHD